MQQKIVKLNWIKNKKRTLTFRNEAVISEGFRFSSIFLSGEYKRHLYTLADYHKPVGYKKKEEPIKNDLREVETSPEFHLRKFAIHLQQIWYKNKANLPGHCVKTLRRKSKYCTYNQDMRSNPKQNKKMISVFFFVVVLPFYKHCIRWHHMVAVSYTVSCVK